MDKDKRKPGGLIFALGLGQAQALGPTNTAKSTFLTARSASVCLL
jgi:hypothetical protein